MARIFIDRRYYSGRKKKWVSFETSPFLEKTKGNIYGRCVPCITSLYEQLKTGGREIELGPAFHCWKIVVEVHSMEACVTFLERLEESASMDMDLKGRFGSGDEAKETKVLVFNAESDAERDELYGLIKECASLFSPQPPVFFHRACADLYHGLLGDWRKWKKTQAIERPEMVKPILARIGKVLFWEKET